MGRALPRAAASAALLGYCLTAPSGRRTGHSEGPAGPEATGARIEAVDSPRAKPGPYTLRVSSKIFCSVSGFGGALLLK